MPVFLELHGADVGQRRMKPAVVVEVQPVDYLVHRLALYGNRLPYSLTTFKLPHKLSVSALVSIQPPDMTAL